MDQNRDWRPIAAIVLAGLALFVALSGARGGGNDQVSAVPQQIIIQPGASSGGTAGGVTVPAPALAVPQTNVAPAWGGPAGWHRGFPIFALFPLLIFAALAFVAFRAIGRRRAWGWGGPGWHGGQWGGPGGGPGPQGPHGPQGPPPAHPYWQYPPQHGQGYGQHPQYGGYPQPQQGQQPQPPQPPQPTDANGDITRPEGNAS